MNGVTDPDISQDFDTTDATELPWWYEVSSGQYWVEREDGEWVSMPQAIFELYLAEQGRLEPYRDAAAGEKVNPVKAAVRDAVMHRRVKYAGALAGWHKGVREINNSTMLVTRSQDLVDPQPGEWPVLAAFLERLVSKDADDREVDQRPYFYGWLQHCLQSLYCGRPSSGLCMVFCGEHGSGKTLLKDIIVQMLGRSEVYPYKFLTSREHFSRGLAESSVWVVDDERSSTKMQDRLAFGAEVKKVVANSQWECRGMHRDGEVLRTTRRMIICVNSDPDRLLVLPPLDDDIRDKLSLLKFEPISFPMPMGTEGEKRAFFDTVVAELPAFVSHLLNEYEIGDDLVGRFGIRHYHHPQIADELLAVGPEIELLDFIERCLFADGGTIWRGRAEDLRLILIGDDSPLARREQDRLPAAAWIGKRLKKLASRFPSMVELKRSAAHNEWVIKAHNDVSGEKTVEADGERVEVEFDL